MAQAIFGELVGDLPYRLARYRFIAALDEDFGGSGVMIPGGEAAYRAYIEARASFVSGNFLATIMVCQGLIENLLGGHLVLDDVGRAVRGQAARKAKPLGKRPTLKELLVHAQEAGVITSDDVGDVERLVGLRNPLTHFRDINDSQNLTRRAMESGVHPEQLMYEDARFAVSTIIRILSKSDFAVGRFVRDSRT